VPGFTVRWAVVGITALLALALTGTPGVAASATAPAQLSCDPVAPAGCLLPFPNNYFTVPDKHSATGLRVHLDAAAMPANALGVHIDPTEWNRQDGFSPGQPILVQVPGLDATRSHIAPVTDIGASLDADAPIVLINARTGKRTPYWAELDAHATGQPDRQVLIIRPAVAVDEGIRYIVGLRDLRDLRDGSGRIIGAPSAFTSALAAKGHQRPPDPRTRSSAAQLTEEKAGDHLVLAAVTDDPHAGQYHRAKAPSRKPFRPSTGHVPRRRSSAESPGHMPSRRAEVTESRVANNVTSTPRATSPSASMPVTCSHGP